MSSGSSRRSLRRLIVAVVVGVMVGGGLMAVTPAGAEVSQSLATSWKKIWKKELRPLADKRYYTKKKSDSTFATKAESAAAAAAAQSAANSATDSKLGSYYKKTESDARYAPTPTVIRGSWSMMDNAPAVGSYLSTDLNWGYTFTGPLAVHFVPAAGPVPAGCSGSAAAPGADPGNLCVFAFGSSGVSAIDIRNVSNAAGTTSPFGANLFATSTVAGNVYAYGSWAARGTGLAAGSPRVTPSQGSGLTDPGQ